MPKRASSSAAPPARSSKRARAVPRRFVPGGSADVPSEFEEMVHSIALEACKASPLPLDCEAVQTLEQALLPAMETFVTAAHAHAVSKGRSEVSDADFNAILAKYKKVRAGKGKK